MILSAIQRLDDASGPVLGTLARFAFAAVLAPYFWASALTKIDGAKLSFNAYAQVFPRTMEAANYNVDNLTFFHTAVVAAGTLAEFILPALLILGLATRLAALGMIGFVAVQTWVDLFGHGARNDPAALGAWFDRMPDSLILDQRLLWLTLFVTLILKGAGPISLDRLLRSRFQSQTALAA